MIICRDLMVHVGLTDNFKHQVLQWDGSTLHIKESSNLLGQSDLTKSKMSEVEMQTAEPVSTQEATERKVKTLNINYAKAELEQLVNYSRLNAE